MSSPHNIPAVIEYLRSYRVFRQSLTLFELVYYPSLFVWIALAVYGTSQVSPLIPNRGMRILLTLFVLLSYCVLAYKPTKEESILSGLVVLLSCCAMMNGLDMVGTSVVMAWCGNAVDFRKAMKIELVALLCCTSIITLLSVMGIIPDIVYGRWVATGEGGYLVERHCLGFGYPTFLSHYWLAVTLLALYLSHWRPTFIRYACVFGINFAIYYFTDARNSFLLVLVVLLGSGVARWARPRFPQSLKPIANQILSHITICTVIISTVLLVMIPAESEIGSKIDSLMSGRVSLTQEAFDQYDVKLFGQRITWSYMYVEGEALKTGYMVNGEFVEAPYLYVDNSYFNRLLTWGLVPIALAIIALELTTCRLVHMRQYGLCIALAIFAVHAILDPQLFDLAYSPFLPLVGKCLLTKKGKLVG